MDSPWWIVAATPISVDAALVPVHDQYLCRLAAWMLALIGYRLSATWSALLLKLIGNWSSLVLDKYAGIRKVQVMYMYCTCEQSLRL